MNPFVGKSPNLVRHSRLGQDTLSSHAAISSLRSASRDDVNESAELGYRTSSAGRRRGFGAVAQNYRGCLNSTWFSLDSRIDRPGLWYREDKAPVVKGLRQPCRSRKPRYRTRHSGDDGQNRNDRSRSADTPPVYRHRKSLWAVLFLSVPFCMRNSGNG
jgi:hypothetical protein